jgi:hypothetical protein
VVGERPHGHGPAQLLLELELQRLEELGLGHAAALELEERVQAGALRRPVERDAQRLRRDAGLLLELREDAGQRGGQDADEVADDRLDPVRWRDRRHPTRRRMS